jgi:hypothetical protein
LIAFVAVFLGPSSSSWAKDDWPILVYPCYQADEPPLIDGRLDEACWDKAPVIGGFTYHDQQVVMLVKTFFRALFDDVALYGDSSKDTGVSRPDSALSIGKCSKDVRRDGLGYSMSNIARGIPRTR